MFQKLVWVLLFVAGLAWAKNDPATVSMEREGHAGHPLLNTFKARGFSGYRAVRLLTGDNRLLTTKELGILKTAIEVTRLEMVQTPIPDPRNPNNTVPSIVLPDPLNPGRKFIRIHQSALEENLKLNSFLKDGIHINNYILHEFFLVMGLKDEN